MKNNSLYETIYSLLFVQLRLYLSNAKINPRKEDRRKAEAPSLSSWTLYLQAELVSGGWHPLFPEQEGEDLERFEARGHPENEIAESQWNRNSVRSMSTPK